GRKSDFYFNLKPTMLDPEGAALLAELTYEALKDDRLDFVGGLEMGAVPLAGAIAQLSWLKNHPIAAFFVRKKPKEHGARLAVEGLAKGETLQGKRVVIVEDVTTTGGSAIKALDAVRDAGFDGAGAADRARPRPVRLPFRRLPAETAAAAGASAKSGQFLRRPVWPQPVRSDPATPGRIRRRLRTGVLRAQLRRPVFSAAGA